MEIKGKVFCLFEQSGTFRDAFIRQGIDAVDVDIENSFHTTDYVADLFVVINLAYNKLPSFLDRIGPNDLIFAFFPCTYFSTQSQLQFNLSCRQYNKLTTREKCERIIARSFMRNYYYNTLIKLFAVAMERNLRMIVENPWGHGTSYLRNNFLIAPTFVDYNRTLRGDNYRKPTAYWFVNCEPTHGRMFVERTKERRIQDTKTGIERSLITPQYADAFIHDYILSDEIIEPQNLFSEL